MFGTRGLLSRTLRASHGVACTDTYSGDSRYSRIRCDVALLHVRERREVSVGERQAVVVVADVEGLPKPFRQTFDEAELAAIRAAPDRRRLELDAERLAFRALDLVDDVLAVGKLRLDEKLVVSGQKLPVEEVGESRAR